MGILVDAGGQIWRGAVGAKEARKGYGKAAPGA
jgi:hypothetical protein